MALIINPDIITLIYLKSNLRSSCECALNFHINLIYQVFILKALKNAKYNLMKASPANELILQKQLADKFNSAPAQRQHQQSNPLLLSEQSAPAFKSMRAQVPSYKQQSETAQPRGLGVGEFGQRILDAL